MSLMCIFTYTFKMRVFKAYMASFYFEFISLFHFVALLFINIVWRGFGHYHWFQYFLVLRFRSLKVWKKLTRLDESQNQKLKTRPVIALSLAPFVLQKKHMITAKCQPWCLSFICNGQILDGLSRLRKYFPDKLWPSLTLVNRTLLKNKSICAKKIAYFFLLSSHYELCD